MRLIDKNGLKYRTVKIKGRYILGIDCYNNWKKKAFLKVEVVGKENIRKYIRNNSLVRYEEE